jgi:hypothetical protein
MDERRLSQADCEHRHEIFVLTENIVKLERQALAMLSHESDEEMRSAGRSLLAQAEIGCAELWDKIRDAHDLHSCLEAAVRSQDFDEAEDYA